MTDIPVTGTDRASEHWEAEAENWVRWARAPGHDSYVWYAESFLRGIVPVPGSRTLEMGCGEGRVVRDLVAGGHKVVGIDMSPTLIRAARRADRAGMYVRGDAAGLPFDDASFDLVVAYNSLMDFEDMPGAVAEATRVLTSGGRLCACVTHPINDAGAFEGDEPDAPFVIGGSYLEHRRFQETFERDGLIMTFSGWTYSLERYSRALEEAGLLIEMIREPAAPQAAVSRRSSYTKWRRVPLFLHIRAIKS
jgi:SAM-dependent methyltransferase